ncbi:MAG: nucleotidyltransferase family protein [Casimicrobium sp.]
MTTTTTSSRRALLDALTARSLDAAAWSPALIDAVVAEALQASEIERLTHVASRADAASGLARVANAADAAAQPTRVLSGWQASLTVEVLQRLTNADIVARVFKGAPLAAWLHGDATVRNSCDIDVLLRPADVQRAISVLMADGWSLPFNLRAEHFDAALLRRYREVPLSNFGGTFSLDLHWRLTSDWNERVVDEAALLSPSAETVMVAGRALPWFAAADVWCVQLSHVVTSDWRGLKAWVDLAWASDRLGVDDWAAVAARLDTHAAFGAPAVAAVAARVLHAVFARSVPAQIATPVLRANVARRVEAVAAAAARHLLGEDEANGSASEQSAIGLLRGTAISRESALARARAMTTRLTTPALDDVIDAHGEKRTTAGAALEMAARRWRSYRG